LNTDVPDFSLHNFLWVPEGPPKTVWDRALEAAFAASTEGSDDGKEFDAANLEETSEEDKTDTDEDLLEDWPADNYIFEAGNVPETSGRDAGAKSLTDGQSDVID
jgi:hypothetical protein